MIRGRTSLVRERLKLFRAVLSDTGSEEDAMWCVIMQDRRDYHQRRRRSDEVESDALVILDAAARLRGFTRDDLLGRGRYGALAEARRVAMKALRLANYSLPAIGVCLKRKHTTVLGALELCTDETNRQAAEVLVLAEQLTRVA